MRRENSFSDSEGRSLTSDEEEEFITSSPVVESGRAPLSSSVSTPGISGLPPTSSSGTPSVLFKDDTRPYTTVSTPENARPSAPERSATTQSVPPSRPGLERFRASVRKVIHLNRGSSALSTRGIGAEPGVDPRRHSAFLNYGHIKQKCTIELVDYGSVRASFGKMQNEGFVEFMNNEHASRREPWVKVRWINIGGVSWDVISALALKYDIHPLALEDVLHERRQSARSKSDYYVKHLFIRILRHTLGCGEDDEAFELPNAAPAITRLPRSSSPDPMYGSLSELEDSDDEGSRSPKKSNASWSENITLAGSGTVGKKPVGSMRKAQAYIMNDLERGRDDIVKRSKKKGSSFHTSRRKRLAETKTVEELKRGERVIVDTVPFYIFLFRDGTVISINRTPENDFTQPIMARLRQRDTGLRVTADPSLLVQSLLDLIVDQALEVVDEYQNKILKLEHNILIKPKMKSVRHLHILSGDLTLHKRTLEPIKTLIYGLRRYDVDRCLALLDPQQRLEETDTKVRGFMSHKAKIYLADVHDHIDYIISSLDMFSSVTENLINYTFNMASYEMNEVMRRLTMATIIFLPLTLLTGYFGMNFDPMWSVNQNSDLLFWKIALPVMAVVIPMFMWPDFERMFHYIKKKWTKRRIEQDMIRTTRARKKRD